MRGGAQRFPALAPADAPMIGPIDHAGDSPSMGTSLTLQTPRDYLLPRDYCSYGYFLLEPNFWSPAERELRTTLDVGAPGRPAATTLRVTQPGKKGDSLKVRADRSLSVAEKKQAKKLLARMMRLNEDHEVIRAFHKVDPRQKKLGRGRLMRSPTFFEDVIKTVTSCNVTWPSTIIMNRRLCEVVGEKSPSGFFAFPSAAKLASVHPTLIRERCSVGYRDARIVELARMFATSEISAERFEGDALSDDDMFDALQDWPGIGPYAAANIMQLLGRYGRLPLDTESVRHGRDVLGFKGTSAKIMKRVHKHFAPFGEHAFRSYWFEMWEHYEAKRGKSWTWERETTGKTFTAAKLRAEIAK